MDLGEVICIVCRIRCMNRLLGNSHQGINIQVMGNLKLRSGMIAFVIEGCKLIGSQYALGSLQHIAHGFAVVAVGDFVVYQQFVLCIDRGLYVVCYFSYIVADDHLTTVRI